MNFKLACLLLIPAFTNISYADQYEDSIKNNAEKIYEKVTKFENKENIIPKEYIASKEEKKLKEKIEISLKDLNSKINNKLNTTKNIEDKKKIEIYISNKVESLKKDIDSLNINDLNSQNNTENNVIKIENLNSDINAQNEPNN
ncbi:hypothetical protein [Cetobacterium sp. SF1]|uniref:hypothetical protein n=1 Tax=Cetobacterium sp. SF1 TaxID=3417654 RepID=UPI003CE7427E